MLTEGYKNLVVIACSTGGPQALKSVIPLLPADLKVPVVIIQHMPEGFTKPLAARLDMLSKVPVLEASDGMEVEAGKVYIAPGGYQMTCHSRHGHNYFSIFDERHVSGLAPCADIFIESLRTTMYEDILCCVMTGMGRDASHGISLLKRSKKVYVITQDKETSTVYGMPSSVKKDGNSNEEVPLERIAKAITKYLEVL